jgi:hypothetical protein
MVVNSNSYENLFMSPWAVEGGSVFVIQTQLL